MLARVHLIRRPRWWWAGCRGNPPAPPQHPRSVSPRRPREAPSRPSRLLEQHILIFPGTAEPPRGGPSQGGQGSPSPCHGILFPRTPAKPPEGRGMHMHARRPGSARGAAGARDRSSGIPSGQEAPNPAFHPRSPPGAARDRAPQQVPRGDASPPSSPLAKMARVAGLKLTAPRGLPRRSPTLVLTGPCAA